MPAAPAAQASAETRSAASAPVARTLISKNRGKLALLCGLSLFMSGCYLGHLAVGQARLMRAGRPIEAILADSDTPDELRQRLETVQQVRIFASSLGLEIDEQYTSYVDWPGDRVITTVIATRPGEVVPAGFWFPFLGRLPYKGFFDPSRAEAEAASLREDGLDVCVVAVPAYSTLGWMKDPVTAPMLLRGEGPAVETILHELVHATVYVKDHIDFDETAASFVGQEASVRFYELKRTAPAARARRRAVEDERAITAALVALRDRIEALYATTEAGPKRDAARAELSHRARSEIAGLPLRESKPAEIAAGIRLNDACLALSGTYGGAIHRYARKLEALEGDLAAFISELKQAADEPNPAEALLLPEPPRPGE